MLTDLDHKILQTVLQEGEPISSKKLAMLCGVAVNTIRKEITILNREISGQGLYIEMKSSVGAYPVIVDPERALPYMSQLRIFYNRSHNMSRQYSPRVYALTRRCLCAGAGLSVEKLCDEFYSSRSTILRELSEVREILRRFDLQLKNHRSSQGLTVEGSEWSIRQCLIHQHKVYMIQLGAGAGGDYAGEGAFRAQFLMDGPEYGECRALTMSLLQEQSLFHLPTIHIPKLGNMLLLCLARRKYAGDLTFSDEQRAFVKDTPEYRFVEESRAKLPARFRDCLGEGEMISLATVLLGFGARAGGRAEYLEETEELIDCLVDHFGYDRGSFDDFFREDFTCYLSQLESRRLMALRNDLEPIGQIRYVGITTGNLCLAFARFYQERHGIALKKGDTMGCFYIMNRITNQFPHSIHAQRVLVFSEFGLDCARVTAHKLLIQHSQDIKESRAIAYHELFRQKPEDWDLVVTDMPGSKLGRYLARCPIPILPVEFGMTDSRDLKLDTYLNTVKQQEQLKLINAGSFHRTALKSKEEVFAFLEELLKGDPLPEGVTSLADYLRENDGLMTMERGEGVVFQSIFTAKPCTPRIAVLLNETPLQWDRRKAQIFVCCTYNNSVHHSRVIASILHKFVYMSPETRQELLEKRLSSPMLVLFPDE